MTETAQVPATTNGTKAKPPATRKPVDSFRALLLQSKEQIALALPRHLTPERMVRMAITAFQRTPALQKCSPLSIVGCVIEAAQLGLELTGPLGQAYMVPYFNKHTRQEEAQFQVGYRGFLKLAFNSGKVSYFNAHEVHANDFFVYEYGTNQRLVHKPALRDRGEVVAFYSVLRLKDGSSDFEVMSLEDVTAHRDRYSKASSPASPWNTAFNEMGKKTLIRRLAKRAPVSVELQSAAALDEYAEAGVPQGLALGLTVDEASSLPPVGRASLRGPAPSAPPPDVVADDVPPDDEPLADYDDSQPAPEDPSVQLGDAPDDGAQELFDSLKQRIDEATSTLDLANIGREMTVNAAVLGERHAELTALYQARFKALTGKGKK